MKISILGAGGWGTTLAILLHYNGHKVTLREYEKHYIKVLNRTRVNEKFLPGIKIPEEIKIIHDLEEATANQNIIVLAVPSQFLRGVIKGLKFTDIKTQSLLM